jgi:hypothetical protein
MRVWFVSRTSGPVVTLAGFAIAAALAAAFTAAPLGAQSKVLTPPRPADSAARSAPAVGSTATTAAPSPAIPQSALLDSIREAVFRNLLARDRAGFSTLAGAFCLGLANADFKTPGSPPRVDASEVMTRRLTTPRTPTRRASGCTFSGNVPATRGVPGRALLYTVGAIDVDDNRADAAAGYNYDGYAAGGYTFTLERSDSGWVVKQWRMEWTGKP